MTELDKLKAELAEIKDNPYYPMYDGLLRQWNAIAKELKSGEEIKLSGDDKAFDRFAKFIEKLSAMTENIEKLRKKVGIEKETELKKQDNPLEKRAR
jgi:uncharacterized protein YdcH (DUF465 family)